MRVAGRILAEALARVEDALVPGVTTAELDRIAEECIRTPARCRRSTATRATRRAYRHASLCISLDDEVVHGIPGDARDPRRPVVSVDIGAIYQGWHADGART